MKEKPIKIILYTTFQFAYWSNIVNVGTALAQAGYYINIFKTSNSYVLNVYKLN